MFDDKSPDNLEISPEDVGALLDGGADDLLLVDVREKYELQRGILPGAVHRPLSRFKEYGDQWPRDKRLIIYCEHGVRSLDATVWLLQTKDIQARSMRGGFAEWHGPVVKTQAGDDV